MDSYGRDALYDRLEAQGQMADNSTLFIRNIKYQKENELSMMDGVLFKPPSPSMSSSLASEEDDDLKNNPYYIAYAKLLHKFKEKNAGQYRAAIQRLNLIRPNVEVTDAIDDIGNQPQVKPKRKSSETVLVKQKALNDIISVDFLLDKSWTQIIEIWLNSFKGHDELITDRIPLKEFTRLYKKFVDYPLFVLKISPDIGEFVRCDVAFTQYYCFDEHKVSNCTVHFTSNVGYKVHEEDAPHCLTVDYYTELCNGNNPYPNNHGHFIETPPYVLMRATYNKELITSIEAFFLINSLDSFYQNLCEIKENDMLLRLFNKDVKLFKHSDVVGLVEKLSITDV